MRVEVLVILGALVASADCGSRSTISESKPASRKRNGTSPETITIGLIVPHTNFGRREYTKAVNRTVGALHKSYGRSKSKSYSFLDKYNFTQHAVQLRMMSLTPSPSGKASRVYFF